MPDFTENEYTVAIPTCCRLTTLEAHEEIMLCWGLANSIRTKESMICGWCEFNSEHTREEYGVWWKEERQKQKVWDILNVKTQRT
jgi:hypothetical protein